MSFLHFSEVRCILSERDTIWRVFGKMVSGERVGLPHSIRRI